MKVIIVLGFSFLLVSIESWLEGKVAISGLLAVVSMACVLKLKSTAFVSKDYQKSLESYGWQQRLYFSCL